MLTDQETIKAITDAQAGSDEAKELLVTHNLPLVKSIVRRYRYKQIEYDDLLGLGTLGLVKAINHFDMTYGVKFSTYAVPMIAGEIKRFIRDDGAIKVSRSIKADAFKINKLIEEHRQKYNSEPTIEQVAEMAGVSVTDAVFIMDSVRYPVSLYAESDDDGLVLMDRIADKNTVDDEIDKHLLKDLIAQLSERDKKIIILRYYRDKTQSEIAELLGVSQVQISRLESKILARMKKELA